MERPSYIAALSVPSLRQQMIEVVEEPDDNPHTTEVLLER